MASRALGLRRDQLDYDAWRKAREVGEGEWGELDGAASVAVIAETLSRHVCREQGNRSLYSPDAWMIAS